jgi:hypothetical protein
MLTYVQSYARGDSHVAVFSRPVGMGHRGSVMANRGVLVQPHRGQAPAPLRTHLISLKSLVMLLLFAARRPIGHEPIWETPLEVRWCLVGLAAVGFAFVTKRPDPFDSFQKTLGRSPA